MFQRGPIRITTDFEDEIRELLKDLRELNAREAMVCRTARIEQLVWVLQRAGCRAPW